MEFSQEKNQKPKLELKNNLRDSRDSDAFAEDRQPNISVEI